MGSTHSKLTARFESICSEKGLIVNPENLPELIQDLKVRIVSFRTDSIEHTSDPRLAPGTPGATVHSDSAEHSEQGFVTDLAENTRRMADKRFKKYSEIQKVLKKHDAVKAFGSKDAEVTLVVWGSTKGVALETMQLLQEEGRSLNFLQIIFMAPFPAEHVSRALDGKTAILVEGNRTAQLGSLIREHTGYSFAHKILRYDGRPFSPLQLTAQIKEVLKK